MEKGRGQEQGDVKENTNYQITYEIKYYALYCSVQTI